MVFQGIYGRFRLDLRVWPRTCKGNLWGIYGNLCGYLCVGQVLNLPEGSDLVD